MSKIPDTQHTLEVGNQTYHYYSLPKAAEALGNIDRLPKTLKILLENQLGQQVALHLKVCQYGHRVVY